MADGGQGFRNERSKKRLKIAFTGEEFGYGYMAADKFAGYYRDAKRLTLCDAGADSVAQGPLKTRGRLIGLRELRKPRGDDGRFDLGNPEYKPLYTKEQALTAVSDGTADVAIVPFYAPYIGYDIETLRMMASLFFVVGVDQIDETDKLCLAVYEPQLLDVVQTSHPGSSLSTVLNARRPRFAAGDQDPSLERGTAGTPDGRWDFSSGLQLDAPSQYMLRDRIDMVFAGPEAARRCKSKLDGLRGAGVEVRETLKTVEPHREMARLARGTLNGSRQTSSFFDPEKGRTTFASTMSAENPSSKLYGVVMPFEIAYRSPDYVIIDDEVEDADRTDPTVKTRFMVVRRIPDESYFDDRASLRQERTRYWVERIRSVFEDNERDGAKGVRVMMRFHRRNDAASVGEVEEELRAAGIRYTQVRIGEDSGSDTPAPVILDIEFDTAHLENGKLKRVLSFAFQRWKRRSVSIMAAMPMWERQLAEIQPRRWWKEGVLAMVQESAEAIRIRYRIPLSIAVGAAASWLGWSEREEIQTFLGPLLSSLGLG